MYVHDFTVIHFDRSTLNNDINKLWLLKIFWILSFYYSHFVPFHLPNSNDIIAWNSNEIISLKNVHLEDAYRLQAQCHQLLGVGYWVTRIRTNDIFGRSKYFYKIRRRIHKRKIRWSEYFNPCAIRPVSL